MLQRKCTGLSFRPGPVRKLPWEPGAEERTQWLLENTEVPETELRGARGSFRTIPVKREAIPKELHGRDLAKNYRGREKYIKEASHLTFEQMKTG